MSTIVGLCSARDSWDGSEYDRLARVKSQQSSCFENSKAAAANLLNKTLISASPADQRLQSDKEFLCCRVAGLIRCLGVTVAIRSRAHRASLGTSTCFSLFICGWPGREAAPPTLAPRERQPGCCKRYSTVTLPGETPCSPPAKPDRYRQTRSCPAPSLPRAETLIGHGDKCLNEHSSLLNYLTVLLERRTFMV